jgi:hypothetical protein
LAQSVNGYWLPPRLLPGFRQSQGLVQARFGVIFMRAVFAGGLIALMVWLLPGAESARVSIGIILTYLIGLGASITSLPDRRR